MYSLISNLVVVKMYQSFHFYRIILWTVKHSHTMRQNTEVTNVCDLYTLFLCVCECV